MKLIVLLFSLFSFNALALEGYSLSDIVMEEDFVRIEYRTNKTHSSMCYLTVTTLKVTNPKFSWPEDEVLYTGIIEVESEVQPNSMCLMAFGPHRGTIKLHFGEQAPYIQKGSAYRLIINGEDQGDLLRFDD